MAQVSDHQWNGAVETLETGLKRKHIDRDIARRRKAALLTAEADRKNDQGLHAAALDMAISAAQDVPEFAPGVALAAKLLSQKDDTKKAAHLIEKSWEKEVF